MVVPPSPAACKSPGLVVASCMDMRRHGNLSGNNVYSMNEIYSLLISYNQMIEYLASYKWDVILG